MKNRAILMIQKLNVQLEGLENIINICKSHPSNIERNAIDFLSRMRITLFRNYCNNFLQKAPLIELWILYYGWLYHSKIWNPSREEWL